MAASAKSAARPTVTVLSADKAEAVGQVPLPQVFLTPIRTDVIQYVHSHLAKNKRQAHAVMRDAGAQTSAESWGTGRAVARIPRVAGGGTHRAGQGAFGNMCRGGRMFAPIKVWRNWHAKTNLPQRRYAVAAALAASAVPALVMARGHRINQVSEIPLVVSNDVEQFTKTRVAYALLQKLHADADVKRVKHTRALRPGKGKARNRRYIQRKGPLVIYNQDKGIERAFRNIPGVELCNVNSLNLLQLAPGGHAGRFVIWTQAAFEKLATIYGDGTKPGAKANFVLPRSQMTNTDLMRIINSTEIQSKLHKPKRQVRHSTLKKNPLKNLGVLAKINPYAVYQRRITLLKNFHSAQRRQQIVEAKRAAPAAGAAASAAAGAKKASPAATAAKKALQASKKAFVARILSA